jgi:hypothetical protein
LSETARDRLRTLADDMGLSPATLAAVAIGEFLAGKDRDALQHRRFVTVEKA